MTRLSRAPDRQLHIGDHLSGFHLVLPAEHRDSWGTHTAAGLRELRGGAFTHLYLGLVNDPTLRETLHSFEQVLKPGLLFDAKSISGPRGLPSAIRGVLGLVGPGLVGPGARTAEPAVVPVVSPDPDPDAVAAVGWIAAVSGLPVVDVLAASDIKERTFHEWKANGRRPRLRSQGRLWTVHQVVQDLLSDLGGESALRQWLLAHPVRRDLFRAGEVQRLRAAAAPDGTATTGVSPAAVAALGDDSEPDLSSGGDRTRPVRGTPTRRTTRASAGPRRR